MGAPNPQQARRIARVEALIRLAQPALDAVLSVGDRVSRIVEPTDLEYVPARPLHARDSLRSLGSASGTDRDR